MICETKKNINVKTETDSHCQHIHNLFRSEILSDLKSLIIFYYNLNHYSHTKYKIDMQ